MCGSIEETHKMCMGWWLLIQGSGVVVRARQREEKKCMISPECLSYGRSRSGENDKCWMMKIHVD